MKYYQIIKFKRHQKSAMAQIVVRNQTLNVIVSEEYVDLYHPDFDPIAGQFEVFKYWITIPNDDVYTVEIQHAGCHNVSAISPYSMEIIDFQTVTNLDYQINTTASVWHSDYPSERYVVELQKGVAKQFNQISFYYANGAQQVFILENNRHASEFIRISPNNGTTWYYPYDSRITWGANITFDDSTILNGTFGCRFIVPPDAGSQVLIDWIPQINKAMITQELQQPTDPTDNTFVDYKKPFSITDYGIEFIK